LISQLRRLRDHHGFEVAVVTPSAESATFEALAAMNIPCHVHRLDFSRPFREVHTTILELAALFTRESFDVVHSHDFNAMLLTRTAGWLAGVPVRATRIVGLLHLDAPLSRVVDRATCWMETHIFGVHYALAEYRRMGVPPDRLAWTTPLVDRTQFEDVKAAVPGLRATCGVPAEGRLVGLVAHFYPRLPGSPWVPTPMFERCAKGHEDFLRAAAEVHREFAGVRFVLVGGPFDADGQKHMEEMRSLAGTLGLGAVVTFAGHRADMTAVLSELDICVQPSLSENMARATIEAMLMARPLVATRVGGLAEIVEDEVTGLLVPPGEPAALAEALLVLLRNPARAEAMGRAARSRALSFPGPDEITDQVARHYHAALEGLPARRHNRGRRSREWLLRLLVHALAIRIRWSTVAFKHPPRTLRDRANLALISVAAPDWGPRVLGPERYRRWATDVFGFMAQDGSFRPRR
jgi:glycosyltransferase involved in cell wall biosynthesis